MSRRLTWSEINKYFSKDGYILTSTNYEGVDIPMEFICPSGHTHKMSITSRKKGVKCSKCSGNNKYSIQEVTLYFYNRGYTLLSEQYKSNKELMPYRCPKGHLHEISFGKFKAGRRCPTCARVQTRGVKKPRWSLSKAREEFISRGLEPLFNEFKNAYEPLPFKCAAGHTSKIRIKDLRRGTSCSFCVRNHRLSLEDVDKEFAFVGHKLLAVVYKNSRTPLDYVCEKGHENKTSLSNLRAGNKCPDCSKKETVEKLKLSEGEVRERFIQAGFTPTFKTYNGAHQRLSFTCESGHKHSMSVMSLTGGVSCKFCSKSGTSKAEMRLASYFEGDIEMSTNNRSVINPYELDIYFPEKKVAVEYCGLYWHAEISGKKDRKYHRNKMQKCLDKGIRLITVFEDEFLVRPEVVVSRIKNAIGISGNRIYARKCVVSTIDKTTAASFLEENHLQGSSTSSIGFGIFFGGKLVGVMTGGSLSRKHVSKDKTLELKRLCFLPNFQVVGGASKLFKVFLTFAEENGFDSIRSYQDMRYGNPFNNVYNKLGFTLIGESKYTPHYTKPGKRYRNQSLRKTPEERLTGKTEWELRREQGFDRIWDCGHRTFSLSI